MKYNDTHRPFQPAIQPREVQLKLYNNGRPSKLREGCICRYDRNSIQKALTSTAALQIDILDVAQTSSLPIEGFDMIISCYTFHHLEDVTAIGRALMKYLKKGGVFCIIDFAVAASIAEHNHIEHHHKQHDHHQEEQEQEHERKHHGDKLSEAAKASIGTHDGFSESFLTDYYENVLELENVVVEDATPLSCDDMEYPAIVAYGRRKK